MHGYVQEKLPWMQLNIQIRLYSRLLQQWREIELNTGEKARGLL